MKETELAEAVIFWLKEQHWTVYQEVQFRAKSIIADIVAEQHGYLWIIETKMAYTLDVMLQASRWPVHYRSIAIPETKTSSAKRDYNVARYYYQIGVIEVHINGWDGKCGNVVEVKDPPLMRHHHPVAKQYLSKLTEAHKTYSKAGSKGGGYLTPYSQTMSDVKRFVEKNPGCTVKDLFSNLGKCHYASPASFKGNLLKSLWDFEKDWCVVDFSNKPYKLFIRTPEAK